MFTSAGMSQDDAESTTNIAAKHKAVTMAILFYNKENASNAIANGHLRNVLFITYKLLAINTEANTDIFNKVV